MGYGMAKGGFSALFGGRKTQSDLNAADREAAFNRHKPASPAPKAVPEKPTEELIELTATDVERAHGIALITFETHDGAPLPGYEPGCHADFVLRTPEGEELVRQFSLYPTHYLGREPGTQRATYGLSLIHI